MYANFDHINALRCARDGSVWVADDAGVHRYFQKIWLENSREDGLPDATVQEILEDQHGYIWAGTPHGLSRYHPEADPDPPRTYIEKPADRELRVREGNPITLSFSGQDKWKFTSSDRLLYSYKLDYRDWSPFTETRTFFFYDLPAGRHVCQARTMDRNGNIDPTPAMIEFVVTLPWYREIRLVLIVAAGATVALFFAALAFNRHRRLLRSYAEVERKVTERTHELEATGRELLHSQKMNALGTLAAGIAHDFNNILSIIKGSAQLIEENPDNPAENPHARGSHQDRGGTGRRHCERHARFQRRRRRTARPVRSQRRRRGHPQTARRPLPARSGGEIRTRTGPARSPGLEEFRPADPAEFHLQCAPRP